jgi:glycosyltransferase involved in cell wall biosynthesis
MVKFLSDIHAILGGSRVGQQLLRTVGVRRLGRAWLRRTVLREELSRPDDVTVLIGVRNRADHRIVNALRSLRAQTCPPDSVRAVVVDYGSEPTSARFTTEVCRRYGAQYVRVDEAPIWSRARCLNVGLRRVDTKFVMTSDVDILLSPRYLADALRMLRDAPLSVVCAPMLDLPEASSETVARAARSDQDARLETWRAWSVPRFPSEFHPSVAVTYTAFCKLIRGYDEYYELWGKEDDDLLRRFSYLGLETRSLGPESFYLHQWHPRFEDVPGGKNASQVQRNRTHFVSSHSILRNDANWGAPRSAALEGTAV